MRRVLLLLLPALALLALIPSAAPAADGSKRPKLKEPKIMFPCRSIAMPLI